MNKLAGGRFERIGAPALRILLLGLDYHVEYGTRSGHGIDKSAK
jgi:hypothetical protein